ncbi:MAG TPA: cytochrome P450 [Acidimicrobiia bacterium]|nr:cytochrome P450 [Acidimicrobiia bacterium]
MAFQPYAAEFLADPYAVYTRLRHQRPTFYDEEWGLTFFTRHADVSALLKDRHFGRDIRQAVELNEADPHLYARIYPSALPNWTRLIRGSFIDLEPPDHTRLRRLVQAAFTRRSAESYRPQIQQLARRLLQAAGERGELDAISGYATPIPLAMIASMLAIPEEDHLQLVAWSHAIVRVFDQRCTEEEGRQAEKSVVEFEQYLTHHFARRRQQPGNELIDALIAARFEGDRLSDEELIATSILVLNAGHEATVHAIGNALLALARWPEQYELLGRMPDDEATAADELLRYDSPLQMFERWVLEDLERNGVALRRGTKVGLIFGSANRDEEVFESPEALDLTRTDNPHVSFGGGVHYCVGAPLARIEVQVALLEFARAMESFAVVGEVERLPSFVFRGLKELPLRISPRRSSP